MIPCKDCLLLGICKHKLFGRLVHECEPLRSTLYMKDALHIRRVDNFVQLINELDKTMKTNFKGGITNI